MEVIEISASTPETAARIGSEYAARYSARGYACECVGVIAHAATVDVSDREEGYSQVRRTGYRPVLRPVEAR